MKPHRALIALLCIGLTGCAASPSPVQLYVLDGHSAATARAATSAPVLALDRIRLADFLARDGIVYREGEHSVRVARQHRWAAPLKSQLRRRLTAELAARLQRWRIASGDADEAEPARLEIMLRAFNGRDDGQAVVAGSAQLRATDGTRQQRIPFREVVALQGQGYAALVTALDTGLTRAAATLARRIDACRACRKASTPE